MVLLGPVGVTHCPYFGWLQWILGLLHETETVRLQLGLQSEHLNVCGLPWAVVLQLDHLNSGLGWCIRTYYWHRGGEGRSVSCIRLLHCIPLVWLWTQQPLAWSEESILLYWGLSPYVFAIIALGVLPYPDRNCLHPTASKALNWSWASAPEIFIFFSLIKIVLLVSSSSISIQVVLQSCIRYLKQANIRKLILGSFPRYHVSKFARTIQQWLGIILRPG